MSDTRWVPCPCCKLIWPYPVTHSPTNGVQIDWTCVVCLHARLASLARLVRIVTSGREDPL